MKHALLFFALLISCTVFSQTYFWVGNGGDWTDLSHWATSSGGSTFHEQLPGPANDVVFDQNSFNTAGQTVQIDLSSVSCRDFVISGAQHQPHLNSTGFYDELRIHGSIHVDASMTRSLNMIRMQANTAAEINTGDLQLSHQGFLWLEGSGPYYLNDSLSIGNLYVLGGNFYSNGHAINAHQRVWIFQQNNAVADFGTSNVYTNLWDAASNGEVNVAQTTIYYGSSNNIFNDFFGGGHAYYHVVFTGEVDLFGSNTFVLFEATSGAEFQIEAGSTQSAAQFILIGTALQPISIRSSSAGEAVFFEQSAGTVDGYFLTLRDNHASGGAAFTAYNSVDLGNIEGWMLEEIQPQTYYWVGGSGDWSDVNHWSSSSGGTADMNWPPTAIDDVVFDANSFPAEGGIVEVDLLVANCNNFQVTTVPEAVIFGQAFGGKLNVYGSIDMQNGPTYQWLELVLLAQEPAIIDFHEADLGQQALITVVANTALEFLAGFSARTVRIEAGTINMANHTYATDFNFEAQPTFSGALDLSDAVVNTRTFGLHGNMANSTTEGLDVHVRSNLYSYGQIFDVLTFEGVNLGNGVNLSGAFTANHLIALPGTELVLSANMQFNVHDFTLIGTEESPISIRSSSAGVAASFVKESGSVNAEWLILQDNHATGGAAFNALHSIDNGNTDGWNITPPVSVVAVQMPAEALPFVLYPNPAHDWVAFDAAAQGRFEVVDQQGRVVLSAPVSPGQQRIQLTALAAGGYIARYIAERGSSIARLMVR
jgi:hypothetical protein